MKSRQLWGGIPAGIGILLLILDGRTALAGARSGMEFCIHTVIPSLLPFFVLSNILVGSLSGTELPWLQPVSRLLGVPEGGRALLVPAYLGGYPMGAQAVADAWKQGKLSRRNACRMLAFCSNAGPAFILGMVSRAFPRAWMGLSLWGIQILSSFLVSTLFPVFPEASGDRTGQSAFSVTQAMGKALRAIAMVCGWVICFQVFTAILGRRLLWSLPAEIQVWILGLLELTSGCSMLPLIPSLPLRYVTAAGFLSLGGLCVTMQTASALEGLPMEPYVRGKLLQTCFSLLLAWAIISGHLLPLPVLLCLLLLIRKKQKRKSGIYVPNAV